MGGPRNAAYIWSIVALALLAACSVIPTPFYLVAPGAAIDLSRRIVVAGHRAPQRKFYLTDVVLVPASILMLAGAAIPGVRIVRRDAVLAPSEDGRGYARSMVDAMGQSQNVAAIVAERAAGLHVRLAHDDVCVVDIRATPGGTPVLHPGDCLIRVGDRPIETTAGLLRAVAALGEAFVAPVRVRRDGRLVDLEVPTVPKLHGVRLGVRVRERTPPAALPVAVRYAFADVGGASGGLMFALEIYAALRDGGDARVPVAGTGTISIDGRVGPVEGTREKYIAAQRAGAKTFLVPLENYAEIAREKGLRVVPVRTFADALAVLRRERS